MVHDPGNDVTEAAAATGPAKPASFRTLVTVNTMVQSETTPNQAALLHHASAHKENPTDTRISLGET